MFSLFLTSILLTVQSLFITKRTVSSRSSYMSICCESNDEFSDVVERRTGVALLVSVGPVSRN